MGSGAFGGFLAGLLGGASEGYTRANEENRKIALTKLQIENQKAMQEAQLEANRLSRESNDRLQNRQLDLEGELGRARIGLGRDELNVRKEESQAERQLRVMMQDADFQNDLAKTGLGAKYQEHFAKLNHALSEQSADRDVGRRASLVRTTSDIETGARKSILDHEASINRELATFKTDIEKKAWKEQKADEFLYKLVGRDIEKRDQDDDDMRQMKARFMEIAALNEADPTRAGSGDKVMTLFSKLAAKAEAGRQKFGASQSDPDIIKAIQIIADDKTDPKAKLTALVSTLGDKDAQDWSKVGTASAGPRAAGKIGMTQPADTGKVSTTGEKFQNDLGVNIYKDDEIDALVKKTPWLAKALQDEFQAITNRGDSTEEIVSQPFLTSLRHKFGRSRGEMIGFLRQSVDAAPGTTLTEKLHNAVRSWDTFKKSSSATPEPPTPGPVSITRNPGDGMFEGETRRSGA